jgi:serine/threonine-protein kinase
MPAQNQSIGSALPQSTEAAPAILATEEFRLDPRPVFDGYEVLSEIGRGGMGIVYRARQLPSGRLVAIKMMLDAPGRFASRLTRFHIEAAAVRRLHHPNIVDVIDAGGNDGRSYIVMELVEGPDLAKKLAAGPLAPREAIQLAMGIAAAVQHAHDAGVVHRDLKPANILLDRDGIPKVTDFGLAKIRDDFQADNGQTASGLMIGTLGYMAPELLLGHNANFHPAADIYGIGCLLYEMLIGHRPFPAKNVAEAVRMAEDAEPVPLRELNPKLDASLEAICMKCLQKEPEARYASAAAIHNDLKQLLCGQRTHMHGSGLIHRLAAGLDWSSHLEEYRSWSQLLVWLALTILGTQTILFVGYIADQPNWFYPIVRAIQFTVMLAIFWVFGGLAPKGASVGQRQVATFCVGFLMACSSSALGHMLWDAKIIDPTMYTEWSALSGLLLVIVGRLHWGWFYAYAALFFALAVTAFLLGAVAILVFGLVWAAVLIAAAYRIKTATPSN